MLRLTSPLLFRLFTWLAAFEGDGILDSAIKHESVDRYSEYVLVPKPSLAANPLLRLEDLQKKYGEQKLRYGS